MKQNLKPKQRASRADDNLTTGKDTGQDRYGQSGLSGVQPETDGQSRYRKSAAAGDPASKSASNPGSGRGDADETRKKLKRPMPKG